MAENATQTIDDLKVAIEERWASMSGKRDRAFLAGLGCALLLHSLFLIGVLRTAVPAVIGAENGSEETIDVSMITDAEFKAKFAQEATNAPAGPAAPPTPPPAQPQPEQTETKPAEPTPPIETAAIEPPPPTPEPEPVKEPEAKPQDVAEPKPEPKSEPPPAELAPSLAEDLPDLLTLQSTPQKKTETKPEATKPKPKPAEAKPTQAQPPRQKQAALDLAPPSTFRGGGGFGGEAGVQRPPGTTRAGWNDSFFRAVIAALRSTMPQLRNTHGRVTVRIMLNENGNIKSTDVVRPSQVSGLDQSVVFATKQTNFPLPPLAANEADRTFLITYIYD
jgi:periplasmic protein TonB